MSKLWKWTITVGTAFGVLCLALMFAYSATKSVVITEQHDELGEGNLRQLAQSILAVKEQYDFIVLINPAHGGANKGNVVNDLQEKTITLEVSKYLEKMSKEGDIGIFAIRQEDIDVSNESRAALIERVKPHLVIDLHVNADPSNERTFGTSVLYNASFYMEELTNVELADILERHLVTEISGKANGIFQDTEEKYPFLGMIQVPAASVEMGYLTNSQEARLLGRDDYQEKIAAGIYKGIQAAREEMRKA